MLSPVAAAVPRSASKGRRHVPQVPRRDASELARAEFAVAYMSDARWYKALRAISRADLRLEHAEWKFIDSDIVWPWGVPRERDLLPTRFADGRCQPLAYKWIEWIRLPAAYRPKARVGRVVEQDLDGLDRVLAGLGRLYTERTLDHLTLFGYGR